MIDYTTDKKINSTHLSSLGEDEMCTLKTRQVNVVTISLIPNLAGKFLHRSGVIASYTNSMYMNVDDLPPGVLLLETVYE